MPKHPCEDGLTPDCFKTYPQWARRAFAYKLLHLLVPKQLTKILPKELGVPFIGPETTIPPGVDLPPGSTVPPNYSFPPGWMPGDPFPPGVTPPPGQILPYPPEGGSPPIFIPPFEPGPIHASSFYAPPPSVESEILEDMDSPDNVKAFGDSYESYRIATVHGTIVTAKVTDMYIRLSRVGNPTDNLTIELRGNAGNIEPTEIITGGVSDIIGAGYLTDPYPEQYWVHFVFPNKPLIQQADLHCFSIARSGIFDPVNYYYVWLRFDIAGYTWYGTEDGRWPNQEGAYLNYQLWGIRT